MFIDSLEKTTIEVKVAGTFLAMATSVTLSLPLMKRGFSLGTD